MGWLHELAALVKAVPEQKENTLSYRDIQAAVQQLKEVYGDA